MLFGVIGHLEPEDRYELWERVLPRMAPGAPIVVELLPITRPAPMPPMVLAREHIGDCLYEASLEGEPVVETDLMRMTSTWRITGGPGKERVVQNTSEWHTFGIEELASETGLVGEQLTTQAGVLRPS